MTNCIQQLILFADSYLSQFILCGVCMVWYYTAMSSRITLKFIYFQVFILHNVIINLSVQVQWYFKQNFTQQGFFSSPFHKAVLVTVSSHSVSFSCTFYSQTYHWLLTGMKQGCPNVFGLKANSKVSETRKRRLTMRSILLYHPFKI